MNTFSLKRVLPALGLLGMVACQPDIDEPKVDRGSADFTNYVAIGNSLTSGYQSGGLSLEGQQNSYPAILAKQFAKAGGGEFVQPLFADAQKDGSGYLNLLGFTNTGSPILLSPGQSVTVTPAGETTPRVVTNTKAYQLAYTGKQLPAPPFGSGANELAPYTGALPNNLAVPGISVLSADATASTNPLVSGAARAYGNLNNFYQRLLPTADRGTKDYVTYISQATPTFFSCWLGNNDVLTYATAGAVADATNPFSNMTDTTSFSRGYRNILNILSKGGTVKGVVANIPNVTNLPYFTAVPVATIIAGIKGNAAIPNAANASLYIRTGAGTVREATATDLLVLPASSVIGSASTTVGNPLPVGVGYSATQSNPLDSKYVLDAAEVTAIVTRTNQLNTIIARAAIRNKVALADMNGFFGSVAMNGFATNAVANNASFIRGNLFSLDGVHPTSRGYAVIANEFIRVINRNYGASVPLVNPNEYNAILLP
ncbi:GDSL-like Lipase/Acylhydrolase [Hymenobacter gelipurpurascens]|uniref:GDSL-like Lipase/Acylhydrolase n=1 Tax=Hymenobacter gelipurpurascens TaxID=89968 RepID=A0A212UGD7_9BACT|nr:SGNH/GDSL hydrolase family protein [Hymenobacter gelipurpurascens]SNC77317.1 GDSL-like Lipase/Acylhydrolase [Hymenobacter gelipurpurascens]